MSITVSDPPRQRRSIAVPPGDRSALGAMVRSGLHAQRRAPLTWGGGLGALTALMTVIWPSIEDSMAELVESYPSSLKEAFGITELDTVELYINAEMLSLIIPFALVIFAVRCATRATVAAEERRYLDTLLSLPVSRGVVVWSGFIVAGLVTMTILGVIWAMTWVTGTLVGTGISATKLGVGLLNVWPLAMAFGGLAILAAGLVSSPGTVTAVASGTAVGMYVMDLVGKLATAAEPLRTVSAFRYYGSAIQDGLDLSHMGGLVIVAVALCAAGARLFERRDVS
ncbi:ABC transporter permease subunit [Paraconexibacter sp.]|uniref:ABC transporter permease subunit n=1 Tax=Paraconexibacter sp. TaxID=2949640 RepID=UPI00356683DA